MYKQQVRDALLEDDSQRVKRTLEIFGNSFHTGFGVEVELDGRKYVVTNIRHGSLAWTSGILKGDSLHSINGVSINKRTELKSIYKLLKSDTLRIVVSSIAEPVAISHETTSPAKKRSSFSLPFTRLNIRQLKGDTNVATVAQDAETPQNVVNRTEASSNIRVTVSPAFRRKRAATATNVNCGEESHGSPSNNNSAPTSRRREQSGVLSPSVTPIFRSKFLQQPSTNGRPRSTSAGPRYRANTDEISAGENNTACSSNNSPTKAEAPPEYSAKPSEC
eukprot:CFRG2485T1